MKPCLARGIAEVRSHVLILPFDAATEFAAIGALILRHVSSLCSFSPVTVALTDAMREVSATVTGVVMQDS